MTDMPDPVQMAKDVKNALALITDESKGTRSLAEDTKKNVEKFFEKYEEFNASVAKKWAEKERIETELKEKIAASEKEVTELKKSTEGYDKRVKDLELLISQKQMNATDPELARKSDAFKGFMEFMTTTDTKHRVDGGWAVFRPDLDVKTLRTDSDVQGGYLVPLITDNEIRKNITEMSPVRSFARVRVASSKTIEIPRRLSIPTASFEGEGATGGTDQSNYGSEQITLYRQTVTIPATLDMMISSAFNLEQEIAMDVGEAFGKNEGTQFVSGLGTKGPQGIIKDTRIESVASAASGAIDWADMINIASKLKRGQNPWFFFNRRTLGYLQAIKSTIGVPIWAPVAGDKPATIWGFPYSSDMIDLADAQTGSGAKPVIFGDLRRGYEIYDLVGISVVRDDLTRKKEAITEWTFRRYSTGRVVIPEAIKVLTIT